MKRRELRHLNSRRRGGTEIPSRSICAYQCGGLKASPAGYAALGYATNECGAANSSPRWPRRWFRPRRARYARMLQSSGPRSGAHAHTPRIAMLFVNTTGAFTRSPEDHSRPFLNPRDGSVSRLTHEPRVSLAVPRGDARAVCKRRPAHNLLRHKPVAGDLARAASVRSLDTGFTRTLHARYFLDATEQGDVLAGLCSAIEIRVAWKTGRCQTRARSTRGTGSTPPRMRAIPAAH